MFWDVWKVSGFALVILILSCTGAKTPIIQRDIYSEICLNCAIFLFGTDRVFSSYRLNQHIFPSLGLYSKFNLHRIPVFSRFSLDRFHCAIFMFFAKNLCVFFSSSKHQSLILYMYTWFWTKQITVHHYMCTYEITF